MTKVLFCAPSASNKGGITIWSGIILNYFKKREDKDIILIHLPMDRSVSLTHLLPTYKRLWYAIKDYGGFPLKLWLALKRNKCDIAHIATVGGVMGSIRDLMFILICKVLGVKSVIHYHCGSIPWYCIQNNWGWRLQEFVIRHAYRVLVLDESSLHVLKLKGYNNVFKIPNPLAQALSEKKEIIDRDNNSILFVGHVVPAKGIYELFDALAGVENIKVYIIGPRDSEIDKVIEQKIEEYNLHNRIFFLGRQPVNVVYEYMRRVSLFVLPTYTEGFPMVIMEAMANGCPIITTPVGAIEEMLMTSKGLVGYLVPVGDVKALKEEIIYCLNHKDETLIKAKLAQEKVYSYYTIECVVTQLKCIWMN